MRKTARGHSTALGVNFPPKNAEEETKLESEVIL